MPHVLFEDVSLSYETADGSLEAIHDLSFGVERGESIVLVGPSGCGKSTTLQLIDGLLEPSAGRVLVDGAPLEGPRRQTALILQDYGLLSWKNVFKNVEMGLKIRKVPRAERNQRVRDALDLVGLEDFSRAYPKELSGGMQQRIALARALALDCDLLLMDEPLSALDALLREQLQDLLLELWRQEGYAQILVTHSVEEAVYLGRTILVLSPRPGHLIASIDNPQMGQDGYRESPDFFARCTEIRELLQQGLVEVGCDA